MAFNQEYLASLFHSEHQKQLKKDFDTFSLINKFLKAWDNGDISDDQKEMIHNHIAPWTRQYPAPTCADICRNNFRKQSEKIRDEFSKKGLNCIPSPAYPDPLCCGPCSGVHDIYDHDRIIEKEIEKEKNRC